MKIGIVGGGTVGQAVYRAWGPYHAPWVDQVRLHDVIPDRGRNTLAETLECDFLFVCLPNGGPGRGFHDPIVEFFEGLSEAQRKKKFILKSTVGIGFTEETSRRMRLPSIVHSPEFLTERTAFEDAANPRINVIGLPRGQYDSNTYRPVADIRDLYQRRWPKVPLHVMRSQESEAVKLAMNSFFSVKVAFWNEIKSLLDRVNANYETVIDAIVAEGRVHPLHTQVPGPDGKRGFGGKCLPKDLMKMIDEMIERGLDPSVCAAAMNRNVETDRPSEAKKR